ncbi:helix-turn-helix domain-containing protein [Shouchella miscanthi]|uniref:helix-turn-helix domain-containing protein n=1 Tax=Shouchella miscanthi TaxID=2598861 RepID=UPI0011A0482F|nr:helix-turn-helix domain-containing protein [Shouchella miscanthi]
MQKQTLVLGERLRTIRKMRGYTQSELAKGICTQGVISNIEGKNGKENPSSNILFQLSERLGVTMSYLYGQENSEHLPTSKDIRQSEVSKIIKNLKARRDYAALNYIVENEKNKSVHLSNAERQYLLWHEAVCSYYERKNVDEAISIYTRALDLQTTNQKADLVQRVELELSLASIYYEEEHYSESEYMLLECLEKIQELETDSSVYEVMTKIHFNLSNVYNRKKEYDKALRHAKAALDLSVSSNHLSLLGDALYQIGYTHSLLGNTQQGIDYIEKSLVIVTLQDNQKLVSIIEHTLSKLKPTESMSED